MLRGKILLFKYGKIWGKLYGIERGLAECRKNLSNLDSEVDDILAMCCKLDSLWRDASLETCQKLQNLLFPNGVLWDKDKDNYRTFDENEALSIIARLSVSYKNKKEENSLENWQRRLVASRRAWLCHAACDQLLPPLSILKTGKRNSLFWEFLFCPIVRVIGLEPTRRKTPDPKSGASTNFATRATVLIFRLRR